MYKRQVSLPGIEIDEKIIVSSTGALKLEKVPNKMVVVGGGYIGLEMGSVWSRLGAKVEVVEFLDHITPGMDKEISSEFMKILKKQGMKFNMQNKVETIQKNNSGAVVSTIDKDGNKNNFECDVVLISVGRKPNTEGLNLKNAGVSLDEKNRIKTDKNFKTNIENIYAIGDVVLGPALAHVASAEGITCVEKIKGLNPNPIDYNNIPGCTYCKPEIASVGYTEERAISEGYDIKVGKFPFSASGKAQSSGQPEGFVKVIFDSKYGEWLGCHMIGSNVTEMIAEAVVGRKLETTGHEVLKSIHPHPTLSEAVMEAVADAYDEVIHL